MLTLFRAIWLCAAMLCIVDAVLVTASVFVADRPTDATAFLPQSMAVSGAFAAVGLLLFGVQSRLAALTSVARGFGRGDGDGARRHLAVLQAYLASLGAGLFVVLAGLTYAIVDRVADGFAVFG